MMPAPPKASPFAATFVHSAASTLLWGLVAGMFVVGTGQSWSRAADRFPRVPPTPPERAEATFEVQHGFAMQLLAAEPLVVDPVDLAYDEDGRAYVVEMRDYPYPEEKNATPKVFPGTVRLLEDRDGDGRFDHSTVFADQLAWPTSVCCYRGGVFVAAAPDLWYFQDTDGDGRADVRRKVFTGFGRYNVQAIMNCLRWGLDGWIYGAAAGNGGRVVHVPRGEGAAPPHGDAAAIDLTRRDFRFDPVTERLEAISGGERFGASFDDWGNRFLCNIRNPVQHVVLPLAALARNPHLPPANPIHDAAESGDTLRVFRISPPEAWRQVRAERWALEQAAMPRSELVGAGYWTSSSGVCVYRGAAFPPAFRGNVFIGEVAGNLIHRQVLRREGATFRSVRADPGTEFVRSRDNWFRPVNFVNAPDGTLTVLDMYRETIEHPWSIPDDIKAQLDLTSGNDRGRLYRLAPSGLPFARPPRLSTATPAELVQHLAHPHAWHRETAQRLLLERHDLSAVEPLRRLARSASLPQGRLHALWTLAGLGALTEEDLRAALRDPHLEIRRNAVALAELYAVHFPNLAAAVAALADDPEPAVRLQVALALGNFPPEVARTPLVHLALHDADDPWLRTGVLASARPVATSLVERLLAEPLPGRSRAGLASLIRDAAATAVADGAGPAADRILTAVADLGHEPRAYAALSGVGQGLARHRQRIEDRLPALPPLAAQRLAGMLRETARIAGDDAQPIEARCEALRLVTLVPWETARPALEASLSSTQPPQVQQTALRVAGSFAEPSVAGLILSRFRQWTPSLREEAVAILLSRPIWHAPLVEALESGQVPASQIPLGQRGRLTALRDAGLAQRAQRVLAQLRLGSRSEVLAQYQVALTLSGRAEQGLAVYRRECATCHRWRGEGAEVGPALESVAHRSPAELLIHILDPHREVSPQFVEYLVRTVDGRTLSGLVVAESEAGLTLRRAGAQEETISRLQLEELAFSGKSLMPEGLEQRISPQEMADLIALIRAGTGSPAGD
jgi:putative membrane-bound dehydrogenase-like protein